MCIIFADANNTVNLFLSFVYSITLVGQCQNTKIRCDDLSDLYIYIYNFACFEGSVLAYFKYQFFFYILFDILSMLSLQLRCSSLNVIMLKSVSC